MQIVGHLDTLPGVYNTVHHEIFENARESANILLEEQFQIIDNSDEDGDLKYLGGLSPDRRPIIFMTGAANAKSDDVVNTPKSYELLKKWTGEANLSFHRLSGIEDFAHGDQGHSNGSRNEYKSIFSKEVVPIVTGSEENLRNEALG